MTALSPFWISALGAALVHFVWQAALVGAVLVALQPWLDRRSAATRYAMHCLALLALPLVFVATLAEVVATGADGLGWLPQISGAGLHLALLRAFPYLVAGWILGMLVLAVRAVGGFAWAQRLRRGLDEGVPQAWLIGLDRLRRQLDIRRPVRLALSRLVPGPCVVGGLRPLILLPLSALTAVPVPQLQALLAHELAHIRRHDYAVNLLQRAVEVVFFFHPAVWWISRQVREERELACDDLAIAACGDRLGYARALLDLAEWRHQAVVAAAGGSLPRRVRRLLEPAAARAGAGARLAGVAMTALVLAGLYVVGMPAAAALPAFPAAPPPVARAQRVSLEIPVAPALPLPRAQSALLARPSQARPSPVRPSQAVTVAWVMTQAFEEVQACSQQTWVTPEILPSGFVRMQLHTVRRCVPTLRPVEVWVLTTT